jgi:hypothetical protein
LEVVVTDIVKAVLVVVFGGRRGGLAIVAAIVLSYCDRDDRS